MSYSPLCVPEPWATLFFTVAACWVVWTRLCFCANATVDGSFHTPSSFVACTDVVARKISGFSPVVRFAPASRRTFSPLHLLSNLRLRGVALQSQWGVTSGHAQFTSRCVTHKEHPQSRQLHALGKANSIVRHFPSHR